MGCPSPPPPPPPLPPRLVPQQYLGTLVTPARDQKHASMATVHVHHSLASQALVSRTPQCVGMECCMQAIICTAA